jgi:hypothetical protein
MRNTMIELIGRIGKWLVDTAAAALQAEVLRCHICGEEVGGHYVHVNGHFSHMSCHDKQLLPQVPPAEPVEQPRVMEFRRMARLEMN